MSDTFKRVITSGLNEAYREDYVKTWIDQLEPEGEILDVGAGTKPFEEHIKRTNLRYLSHDFNGYTPNLSQMGLQSTTYFNSEHDFICDITDLPHGIARYLICTEVLEHVPNPVLALESIINSLKPGGRGLITVPLGSLIHQAPHYFSAGLSPWWFENHFSNYPGVSYEINIVGDYVDFMIQEIPRIFGEKHLWRFYPGRCIRRLLQSQQRRMRKFIDKKTLESGGIGVYVQFTRKD